MNENKVEIPIEKYDELLRSKFELDVVKKCMFAAVDDSYDGKTTMFFGDTFRTLLLGCGIDTIEKAMIVKMPIKEENDE